MRQKSAINPGIWLLSLGLCFAVGGAVPALAQDVSELAGDMTSDLIGRHAIQVTAPNVIDEARRLRQLDGFTTFHRTVRKSQGLGPRFNSNSCGGCHINNGKGAAKFPRGNSIFKNSPMIIKVGLSGKDRDGSQKDIPRIGEQLQDHSTAGKRLYNISLSWRTESGRYPDGTRYSLRRPALKFDVPGYHRLKVKHALFMTPPVIGPGLLEAVSEQTILEFADPSDANNDGISGRPNYVPNRRTGGVSIGRFGYKAVQPTLEQQTAAATFGDLGVSNVLFREKGKKKELSDNDLDLLVIYQALAGVQRANDQTDPAVAQGFELFKAIGCDACHRHTMVTADTGDETGNQIIHPFTDLLLHDMGPGLASTWNGFKATGREWRTAPLWGLGKAALIAEGEITVTYLHDGRARTLEEAILWHGGEGSGSRDRFKNLTKAERDLVVAFLKSL